MLKMKQDGKVELYVDLDVSLESCPLPTKAEVEGYYEACRRENRKTRSEMRRKRQRSGNCL
jgi:hypothetical protein